jgi:hypothetical protein
VGRRSGADRLGRHQRVRFVGDWRPPEREIQRCKNSTNPGLRGSVKPFEIARQHRIVLNQAGAANISRLDRKPWPGRWEPKDAADRSR